MKRGKSLAIFSCLFLILLLSVSFASAGRISDLFKKESITGNYIKISEDLTNEDTAKITGEIVAPIEGDDVFICSGVNDYGCSVSSCPTTYCMMSSGVCRPRTCASFTTEATCRAAGCNIETGCGDGECYGPENCRTCPTDCNCNTLYGTSYSCSSTATASYGCVRNTPTSVCGNGKKETGEGCDDGSVAYNGNNIAMSGDGCSATCVVESGWICEGATGSKSVCYNDPAKCIVSGLNWIKPSGSIYTGDEVKYSLAFSKCDGLYYVINFYEKDTGNRDIVDTINSASGSIAIPLMFTNWGGGAIAYPWTIRSDNEGESSLRYEFTVSVGPKSNPAQYLKGTSPELSPIIGEDLCNNNQIDSGEDCDFDSQGAYIFRDTTSHTKTCSSYKSEFTSGNVKCTSCDIDVSDCGYCGNGYKNDDEACDDKNTVSTDGCSYPGCQIASGYECLTPGQPCRKICGNGKLDADEECDASVTSGIKFDTMGGSDVCSFWISSKPIGKLTCNSDCTINIGGCSANTPAPCTISNLAWGNPDITLGETAKLSFHKTGSCTGDFTIHILHGPSYSSPEVTTLTVPSSAPTSDPVSYYKPTSVGPYIFLITGGGITYSSIPPSSQVLTVKAVSNCPGESNCVGTTYYECVNNVWTNKGEVVGKCGVACLDDTDKCDLTTYYTCSNNQWSSQSNVVGKCGVECTSSQTKCDGTTYYTCSNNKWSSQDNVVGKCGVECTSSQTKCDGTTYYTCSYSNTWSYQGNVDGKCGYIIPVEVDCNAGDTTCDGTTYYTCSNNEWSSQGNVVGKCGVECTSSQTKCNEVTYYTCSNNKWSSQGNVVGKCGVECTSSQTKCESTTYYTCSNNEWSSQGNVDGKCGYTIPVNVDCNAGDTKCSGTTYYTCSNNEWSSQGNVDGKCGYTIPVNVDCNAGDTKCSGTTYYTCSNNEWSSQGNVDGKCGYTVPVVCTENEVIEAVIIGGTKTCTKICKPDKTWGEQTCVINCSQIGYQEGNNNDCVAIQCIDSDNGKNLSVKGKVTVSGIDYFDECSDEEDKIVLEYWCREGVQQTSTTEPLFKQTQEACPTDQYCLEGACVSETVQSCSSDEECTGKICLEGKCSLLTNSVCKGDTCYLKPLNEVSIFDFGYAKYKLILENFTQENASLQVLELKNRKGEESGKSMKGELSLGGVRHVNGLAINLVKVNSNEGFVKIRINQFSCLNGELCPGDYNCFFGVCSNESLGCISDLDCGFNNKVCKDYTCQSLTSCINNSQCPGKEICLNSQCVYPNLCVADDDCLAKQSCVYGICKYPLRCTSNAECYSDERCKAGFCEKKIPCTLTNLTNCSEAQECSSEGYCEEISCDWDTDCPGGDDVICKDHICAKPKACIANADCLLREVCQNGFCKETIQEETGDTCSLNPMQTKKCTYNGVEYTVQRKVGCQFSIAYSGLTSQDFTLNPLSQINLSNNISIKRDASPCTSNLIVLKLKGVQSPEEEECSLDSDCPEGEACIYGECKNSNEIEELIKGACQFGCFVEEECYPIGYRLEADYCGLEGEFISQAAEEDACSNNFECVSNVCVNGKCISQGLMQKMLDFFKAFFS